MSASFNPKNYLQQIYRFFGHGFLNLSIILFSVLSCSQFYCNHYPSTSSWEHIFAGPYIDIMSMGHDVSGAEVVGQDVEGHDVEGHDVAGAVFLGQNVVGQEVSDAGRLGAELSGTGRHWGNISELERRGGGK